MELVEKEVHSALPALEKTLTDTPFAGHVNQRQEPEYMVPPLRNTTDLRLSSS